VADLSLQQPLPTPSFLGLLSFKAASRTEVLSTELRGFGFLLQTGNPGIAQVVLTVIFLESPCKQRGS